MRWCRCYDEEVGRLPTHLNAVGRSPRRLRWAQALVASFVEALPPEMLQARLLVLGSAALELQLGWRLGGLAIGD
jgi:hypothetical protein